ncbi:MAG: Ribosomal silencing factor RsfS [Phycisphaerae bacterium]|nr:Ribosomal silencing factor RsfS [Phycisphaerae bacterium]
MSSIDARQFAVAAARLATELKCSEVVVLDLRGKCGVADYFVIATGTSERQMIAVGEHIDVYAASINHHLFNHRRLDSHVWVLLDYVDVVIHIFDHDHRDYYDLELLWGDAPKVEWSPAEPVLSEPRA